MTRKEILENRRIWIEFLKTNPPKFIGKLENIENQEERCCLGHGCHIFNIDKKEMKLITTISVNYGGEFWSAPEKLVELLGLRDEDGTIPDEYFYENLTVTNLLELNDETDMNHRQIGEYLESVIEGGDNSPFLPLEDYPE